MSSFPPAPRPASFAHWRTIALWIAATALVSALAFVASKAVSSGQHIVSDVTPAPELHPLNAASVPESPSSSGPHSELAPTHAGGLHPPRDEAPETCVLQSPLTEAQLLTVLWDGHVAWSGKPPPPQRLACAFAHCALEHARGRRLFANNLGHVTTSGGWTGRSCLHSWTERSGTHPDRWNVVQLQFRVHDTLQEGALDYWKLMGSQYRTALDACDAGDAEKAGRILGELGYYTSDVDSYATAMKGLFVTARKRIKSESGNALRP